MVVYIVQCDNRPLHGYIEKSSSVNRMIATYAGWNYIFKSFNISDYGSVHPASAKMWILRDILKQIEINDILVFLDSDAWIESYADLNNIIHKLSTENKHGAFSRDPYVKRNTYINSGSFIIKNSIFMQGMYDEIIQHATKDRLYLNIWPFDQKYISDAVYTYRDNFLIFEPIILNTPHGIVLRHNWLKDKTMYDDLEKAAIRTNNSIPKLSLDNSNIYDTSPFPNTYDYSLDPKYWRAKMTAT